MRTDKQRPHKSRLSQYVLSCFAMALLAVGAVTLGVNYYLVRQDFNERVEERAQSIARSLEFATEGLIELENTGLLRRTIQNFATLPAVKEVAVVGADGVILASSANYRLERTYEDVYPLLMSEFEETSATGIERTYVRRLYRQPTVVQLLPFSSTLFGKSNHRGIAMVILDLQQIRQEAWQIFITSTSTLTVGIVAILVWLGLLLRKSVLHPLKRLDRAIANSQYTGTFEIPDGLAENEIKSLALTFDDFFERRNQAEVKLRKSEARERAKSQALELAISDLKHVQLQLIQTEKMSGLGQMVAGVAHEINNPVSFIHGNLIPLQEYIHTLLKSIALYQEEYPQPSEPLQKALEAIEFEFIREDVVKLLKSMEVGTNRIRQIVLSLRIFSRLDESDFKQVDISEGIESTLMLLQSRLKATSDRRGIEVIKQYESLPKIECYPSQLNQVFLHLFNNAIDALEESNRENPQIRIAIERVEENWLSIRIADNGQGISDAVRSKLFDPFFTTKPIGKGTGLGLSISYQIIVDRHGGKLTCQSTPGAGTEFAMEIPIRQWVCQAVGAGKIRERSS